MIAPTSTPAPRSAFSSKVNCETDFVARTVQFQDLVKGLAMRWRPPIPSGCPRREVPPDVIEREGDLPPADGRPKAAPGPQKIIEGKLSKFYEDSCLVDQAYIRDASGKLRVGDLVAQVSAQTGEKIAVRRFARFQVGE